MASAAPPCMSNGGHWQLAHCTAAATAEKNYRSIGARTGPGGDTVGFWIVLSPSLGRYGDARARSLPSLLQVARLCFAGSSDVSRCGVMQAAGELLVRRLLRVADLPTCQCAPFPG